MESTSTLIPHIVANAQVPITLNTANINGLYAVHQVLLELLGLERIEALKIKFESKQPIDSKELSFICITQILDMIYKSANANGLTEMRPLDESIKQAIQSQTNS